MAGETIRSEAICLDIRPWSKTSHVVSWLTPAGKVVTVVKGAVRPKSAFLGQYDFNYTCDILYYARARGELHALRDCVPLDLRDGLRGDYRALALAGYYRRLASELAPTGDECRAWYDLLSAALSDLPSSVSRLASFVRFELKALDLSGLGQDFSGYDREADWSPYFLENGSFSAGGGRTLRLSRDVAEFLDRPGRLPKKPSIPLDAARAIGVIYQFNLDCASDVRRTVLKMISENEGKQS